MYLVIVGGNMNKTDEEKELENQEQMKFLQDNSKLKDYRHKNEVVQLNFIDKEHKDFYEKKLKEYGNLNTGDIYYKALVYTLRNL